MVQMEDEVERTLYCGNLHEKVTEEILYELFLQAGPLEKVKIVNGVGPRYSFITFQHSVSVPYTISLMNGIRLFDRPLKLQPRSGSSASHVTPAANGQNPASVPITMLVPTQMLPPHPPPSQPLMFMGASQPPPMAPWLMNSTVGPSRNAATPGAFVAQQLPPFHRSASEPDSLLGAMRNSHRSNGGTGSTDPRDRMPYSRPPRRDYMERPDTTHSPMMSAVNVPDVGSFLQAMRQTPRSTGSHWDRDRDNGHPSSSSSRYRNGRDWSSDSRRHR